jgi:hypothetical protein
LTPATRSGAPEPSTIRFPDTRRPGGAVAALALVVATASVTAAMIAASSFVRLVKTYLHSSTTTLVRASIVFSVRRAPGWSSP